MGYISTDPADKAFSQWIRLRDGKCVRCHSPVRFNDKGLPVSHDASHYFGRGAEGTRFEPDNVDTLCKLSCHTRWGSTDKEDYRQFKLAQLGEDRFKTLTIQAKTVKRKDRKLEAVIWKQALKELLDATLSQS